MYTAPIGDMMNGKSLSQILELANAIMGGLSSLPHGYSFQGLNNLLHNINTSFVKNQVSSWAIIHLHRL